MHSQPEELRMMKVQVKTLIKHLQGLITMIEDGRTNHAVGMQVCAIMGSAKKVQTLFNAILKLITLRLANGLLTHPVCLGSENEHKVRHIRASADIDNTMELIKFSEELKAIEKLLAEN